MSSCSCALGVGTKLAGHVIFCSTKARPSWYGLLSCSLRYWLPSDQLCHSSMLDSILLEMASRPYPTLTNSTLAPSTYCSLASKCSTSSQAIHRINHGCWDMEGRFQAFGTPGTIHLLYWCWYEQLVETDSSPYPLRRPLGRWRCLKHEPVCRTSIECRTPWPCSNLLP